MRTRYLNNDYFTLPPSQRHETIPFLHLPVPRLPTPLSSAVDHHLNFYSPLPDVSLYIDPFPIHSALSFFLSSVLPHKIAIPNPDPSSSVSDYPNNNNALLREADFIFEDHVTDADIEFSKESKTVARSNENEVAYEAFQFETPEQLDTLLENVCFTVKERMEMLSHTPEVENSMEMFMSESLMQYSYEDLDSVSRMEDVISEYLNGENACALEGNISVQHLPYSDKKTFLILEVDEERLGIPTRLSMGDIVESYFENLRPQSFDEQYQSIAEGRELLDSKVYDVVKLFSEDCVSKKSLILSDLFPERDFLNMLENEHVDGTLQADSDLLVNLITFQEFVFLDEDMINNTFEAFYDTKALNDLEASVWMFKKEFNFKSFDELVVSNEMALVDDTFRSLPVPVISDHIKMIYVHDIIGELFSNMKTQPLSASDGIYLNWDLLEEDKCNYNISNWYQNIWAKIDMKNHDFREKSFDNRKMIFDLVFFGDSIVECDHKNSKELQNLLCDRISQLDSQPVEFAVSTLLEHGSSNKGCREQLLEKYAQRKSMSDISNLRDTTGKCDLHQSEELQKLLSDSISQPVEFAAGKLLDNGSFNQGHQEQLPERNVERVSLLFKSMSEISNLDYFLNPQKATVKESCYSAVDSTNVNVNIPKYASTALKPGIQSQGWRTVLHRVKLSDNIVALARYFGKSYLAILQSDTELTKTHKSDVHCFELLSLQKHKLIEFHVNGNNMAFIVLSAIKQAVWYLCFYGLNPACLYLEKLCQNMGYLKSRLGILQSLIKDENRKMENNITMAHSSLTIVKEILQGNIKQDSLKALIVAEEVFWWSLKNLLLSLRLSFGELNDSYRNLPEESNTKMMELLSSDCLLVSYKHVSPLFPFNKFGIILEYGGPNGSSRISEFPSNSVGLLNLHFLTVELNDHAVLKALCQGVETPMLPETETPLIFNHKESMVNRKLERLLNFYPTEQRHDIKSSKAALETDNFMPLIPAVETENNHQSLESFTGSIIIVNTQNVDKEMIVSRRSSYQVILALEKRGIQVAERDLDLPVDIILSSAVCLAWYDSTNLWKKATPATEASSSLPLCIDNIATDVLPLLSFYFCGCFLVFEGEFNFLSTVMEYSDGLYAAATSLGMDLQIFFSYSPELTNKIMINCIKSTAIQTRGLYSKMPDSVTLAESFLTQFPGINPLTAQSILTLGVTLNEFLTWSHEQRVHVLGKYNVPEQSLSLLSIFCKYGEREDSKSIMTDCSSSVSSGPDSDRCRFYQFDNKRKRPNPVVIDQSDELCFDELLQFKTLNQVVEAVPGPSTLQNPYDLGMSKDAWRSRDSGKASLHMSDPFYQKQNNIATTMRNHSRVSPSSWNCKAPQIYEQLEQPSFSLKNKGLAQNEIMDNDLMGKNLKWHNLGKFEKLHEGIKGEVVDLTNSPLLDESFSISESMYFPNRIDETEKDHLRKNKILRKLSFGSSIHSETNSIWRSMKDTGEVDHHAEPDFGKDTFPLDFNPHGNIDSTPVRNLGGLTFEEGVSYLSETPLSRVRRSATPLKHSPWTTEFINKVKEKSKLRQKSVLCGNSSSFFGYQGNISKASKKRSPSTLDSFRYQPSKTPGNIQEQKRQKQSGQSSNSAKKGRYPVPISSWTPNDKRSTMSMAGTNIWEECKWSSN
ncbi:protein SHORTAGE IN CHIASMATA 1 isoform X2 [Lathyrus oleraceus]|uniref:protein SHORTAGE IN CHIASMATA 1 isoform X2 n=1 Tax=Pisum sativum TaxID=3888 RepID=UPI0021D025F4|nr:protein SHORTAGE IN CHIASMATA 1 isoform X2 [Pisum sativum]